MKVAVTGTPGTGKTTATGLLEERLAAEDSLPELEVIHLNRVLDREGFYTEVDADRESKVADLDALSTWLEGRDDAVVDSHLAHHFDADRVVVLRCGPEQLEERLLERGETASKARENAESEALDVVLSEAVEEHGLESVYEIDTTDCEPAAVVDALEDVVTGDREPSAGEVDFVGYLT
ncbi:adenylate kinase family protein [Natronobacterium gregoryi]|uniref:Putative adenylate kinase n=2 Tax=Natronobacterium gregoryi TaxID=44930 RepID=L0ALE6_NATGS|nr:adenylate kinase family protein [Natronobacterium gregoryi]AFZ74713.1 putative nucleoside kinase, CMP and AMP kinase [Natronobacterium gregoryi SP2]ELY73381.1 adenylate kinase [Natronobacterium gregoryi SP2]PLK20957.1 adenylate kinase [Natronobacterium gregoryi SP2]SFJ04272.1 adenylate kinase [Natronobacterium gregoryi]